MNKKDLTPRPIGTPGPFQIIEHIPTELLASPNDAPKRRYECANYEGCLDLAAALNWDSFTCRGCNEEINRNLIWRAHQAKRHDSVANSLCSHLPTINVHRNEIQDEFANSPELPPTGKSKLG